MDATVELLPSHPLWQRQVRSRLLVSLGIATLIIAVALAGLRFPVATVLPPGPEILLRLLPRIVEPLAEIPLRPAREPSELRTTPAPATSTTGASEQTAATPSTEDPAAGAATPHDWYGEIPELAKQAADELERDYSVNPAFARKRREAAVKFRPSAAPPKREIWDNVETDQLGRKILVYGNCHRVIDDYSAANYDIFREFQQHLVYCTYGGSASKELPWVQDIRDDYLYLKYPDGEIPPDELAVEISR